MSKWHYDLTLRDGGARVGVVEADGATDALCQATDQEQEYDIVRAVVREDGEALEELKRQMIKEAERVDIMLHTDNYHEDTPCLDPHPFDGVSYPDGY